MSSAWAYLGRLSRHPHRGSATAGEAAAAAEMKTWLEALGYRVETQVFRTPRDTLYLGPAVVIAGFLAAALLGRSQPLVGLLLGAVLLIPMVGELLGHPRVDFDLLLPRYRSQNLVVRRAASGLPQRRVVVSAHYDTQRASALFHPRVAPHLSLYFTTVYALLAAVLGLLVLRWALPGLGGTVPLLTGLAALLGLNLAFLLLCRFTGGYINGANDNGTGAALVLALADRFAAEPLADTELWFLLTGAEEVGTRGMKHFVRNCGLDPRTTTFLNLDNLGGGAIHYLLGEGMLAFQPYSESLISLASALSAEHGGSVRPKRNLLLPTDGAVPALAGYPAISFLAFQADGSLPDYHWYTDTLAEVDRSLVEFAERFFEAYVRRVAANTAVRFPSE